MMASSELETVWGSSWDRSTEELRQAMIEFAERQKGVLKAEWIALLRKGFGEDYDREYPLQPLVEEHKKTQELQGTQESSVDDRLLREIPLSNFVEHLLGNASGESETPENQVLYIPLSKSVKQLVGSQSQEAQTLENFVEQNLDLASLGKSNEHVVCEPFQRVPCDSWVSKSGCTRQSQLLEVILVKREFHRARWKRKMKSDYRSFVLPFRHFQPPGRRLKIGNGELNLVNQTLVEEYQHVKVQRSLGKQLYHRIWIRSSNKDPAIITSPHGPERYDVKLVKVVEAILETSGKLEQWSKEPESAIAVYNLFGLIPEEDKLFFYTILLRLVHAYCFGDKFVKLAVVRVFISMFKLSRGKNLNESATWFLSKARIHNHLESLKRVKNVYDKGDTEAKALAFILFGCWRDFTSEFAPVRYLIFTSMVSSHDLKTMLADVRVFAKMGCSHAIANREFKICMNLMMGSSKEDNVVPFLVSLTKFASRSTHPVSELAEVIMAFLGEDKTSHTRVAVLRCLHLLITRGMCFSLVHEREIATVSSLLKQEELSSDVQLKALQIFQKILVYKLCIADASELHKLIAIVKNASHSQIFSRSCIAISILVGIWREIVRTADIRSIEVSSTSLPLHLIILIMDKFTLLGQLCCEALIKSPPSLEVLEVAGNDITVNSTGKLAACIASKQSLSKLILNKRDNTKGKEEGKKLWVSYVRSLLGNWKSLELKFKSVKIMCGWVYDKGKMKLRNKDEGNNKEKTVLHDKGELNCELRSNLWLGTGAGKEKKVKKTKPKIIENDAKKVEVWSFSDRMGKGFKVFETLLVIRVMMMKGPKAFNNYTSEELFLSINRLLGIFGLVMVHKRLLELKDKKPRFSGGYSLETEADQAHLRVQDKGINFINKAESEVQGKRLLGSNVLSLLVAWRSLKQNTTQRERHVVYDNMVVAQALLASKWEPLSILVDQFLDFNLEDKVSLLRGSIDRLRVLIACIRKKMQTKGRKARGQFKIEAKSG